VVQNAIELRPGVEYLTLRCLSCGHVFDAQAGIERPASPAGTGNDQEPILPK
jgi:hypothetical protein